MHLKRGRADAEVLVETVIPQDRPANPAQRPRLDFAPAVASTASSSQPAVNNDNPASRSSVPPRSAAPRAAQVDAPASGAGSDLTAAAAATEQSRPSPSTTTRPAESAQAGPTSNKQPPLAASQPHTAPPPTTQAHDLRPRPVSTAAPTAASGGAAPAAPAAARTDQPAAADAPSAPGDSTSQHSHRRFARLWRQLNAVPGGQAIHLHLPLTPDRISQLAGASPDRMRAISNFFANLVGGVLAGGPPAPAAWHHDAPTPDFKVRWDRAAAHFASLPLETFYDRAALERLTVRELKGVAAERGVDITGALEKGDVVTRLLERGDTSSGCDACPICSEAYVPGEDTLRVLPCAHRFHIECIDHWFLNPVDYQRAPSCPMCKKELPLPD